MTVEGEVVKGGATMANPLPKYADAEPPEKVAGVTLTKEEKEKYKQIFIDPVKTQEMNRPEGFTFSDEELIEMAKLMHVKEFGCTDASVLADDFEFVGPVIGPLSKEKFLKTMSNFKLGAAFPNMRSGIYDLRVDPFMPNRVWYNSQARGTHEGPITVLNTIEATGKEVWTGPQVGSFIFNNEGKLRKMTVGYVVDKDVGNCGGLGALFGFLYAIGHPLPVPEAKPYKISFQLWAFTKIGELFGK